jgi:hypothetical protein
MRVQNNMRTFIMPLTVAACVLCTVTPTSTAFSAAPAVVSLSRTQAHARKGGHTTAFRRVLQRRAELLAVGQGRSSVIEAEPDSPNADGAGAYMRCGHCTTDSGALCAGTSLI